MAEEKLIVKGARTHNLKNITVEMPRNKMIVFTGLSGSGKSSLAFDTIFAEGQRRYIESLSAYARQFIRELPKPDVDEIIGLSPAISIDQKSRSSNPRSTVATITEIYDYLRVLFARVGKPHCLRCGREIRKLSSEEIRGTILEVASSFPTTAKKVNDEAAAGPHLRIYAPVVVGRKGEYYQLLYDLLGKGYSIVKVDGAVKQLRDRIILERYKKHDIDVLVDEFPAAELKSGRPDIEERLSEAIERALQESDGLVKIETGGGVRTDGKKGAGAAERIISAKFMCPYDGFSYPEVEPRLFSFNSPYGACVDCHGLGTKYFFGEESCPACKGARLREETLNVFLGGDGEKRGLNIVEWTALSIMEAKRFCEQLKLSTQEREIAKVLLKEILSRLQFMIDVGIEYLTLDRRAHTLSSGEAQRIRLASQLGSGLVGALYVLDEPTIGLHPRDNHRLIKTLQHLRDLGNTIIVVEHDEDTIFSSDYLVDLGPGAGIHGGRVVAHGYLDTLLTEGKRSDHGASLTLSYLRDEKAIPIPSVRRTSPKGELYIRGGTIFNLKNVTVRVPLGKLVVITGVSGSGKSTLLYEILYRNLRARFDRRYRSNETFNCKMFTGTEYLTRAILIDQSPIGRTPRSNPATYTGAWTFIRQLFAETEAARVRGWGPGRFSFNVVGGRCEACQGNGEIAVEMHFLPTVYVTCNVCQGRRFMKETLAVRYKKKNVYDVLRFTVEEALTFFEDIPGVYDRLKTLTDVGLGYVELGQSATTFSGGEAQRVKISSELYRPYTQKTIYLLDEPTIGLHYEDMKKLIEILQTLVDRGNTVVVIEHNLFLIRCADHVIDLGPEGGEAGGKVVTQGTPEKVADVEGSYTGQYLRRVLKDETIPK